MTATVTTRPDTIYVLEFTLGGNVLRLSSVDAQRILDSFPTASATDRLVVLRDVDGETATLRPETDRAAFTLTTTDAQ